MTDSSSTAARRPLVLEPVEGRAYPMGPVSAVFKKNHRQEAAGRPAQRRTR
jgi:hypothetical protein